MSNDKNCYNCFWGSDGKLFEVGHCILHSGESSFIEPDKSEGCDDWKTKEVPELFPCPFCGSEAEYYGDCDMVKARCSNEDCQCELISWFDEPEEAAEEWNKRAAGIQRGERKHHARLRSDYSPETTLSIIRNEDGDFCLRIFGKGEMRIAMSGSRLRGDEFFRVVDALQNLIDVIPEDGERND